MAQTDLINEGLLADYHDELMKDHIVGGTVFDISSYHATGTPPVPVPYVDLAAALGTNGANVPASMRKGGMSVKFIQGTVQSSDNKYVQYRLMADDWSINTDDWALCSEDALVENPEWVKVVTDNEGKILYGVKTDGKFYFGDGCPPQVVEYVTAQLGSFNAEDYADIKNFLGNLVDGDTLATLLNGKVDKVTDKSLIDANVAENTNYIQNSEWIQVTTDSEGKILEGITTEGKKKVMVETEIQGVNVKEMSEDLLKSSDTLDIDSLPEIKEYLSGIKTSLVDKKVSIIGDSICTYNQEGYKIDGAATYYPYGDVTSVNDTWWKQFIDATDSTLEVNASWASSRMSNNGDTRMNCWTRLAQIGSPDVILIALGTNDSINNVEIGTINYNENNPNLNQFAPAYIYSIKELRRLYPSQYVICISFYMEDEYANTIREIAEHYGMKYLDLRFDNTFIHPNKQQMQEVGYKAIHSSNSLYSTLYELSRSSGTIDGALLNGVTAQIDNKKIVINNADTVNSGLMSASDKSKLDDIPAGGGSYVIEGSGVYKNASAYGFLPTNDPLTNSNNFQACLDGGGTIVVDIPGTYQLCKTMQIESNTKIIFGAKVFIEKVTYQGGTSAFIFINKGALTKTYNENIEIHNLHLITNGLTDGYDISHGIGLRGQITFFYVKHLKILGFYCSDNTSQQFNIQVCTFEDIELGNIHIISSKDGVHLGRGSNFHIHDCELLTDDDGIALNADDYPDSNPESGWIENGVVENIVLLPATQEHQGKSRFLLLGGSWLNWTSGMTVHSYGDTVVSNGKMYVTYGNIGDPDLVSTIQPTHNSGSHTYSDGVKWYMKQYADVVNTCSVRNVHYNNITVTRDLSSLFVIFLEANQYRRSYYEGAAHPCCYDITIKNVNIVKNVSINNFLIAQSPFDNLKIFDCDMKGIKNVLRCYTNLNANYPAPITEENNVLMSGCYYDLIDSKNLYNVGSSWKNFIIKISNSIKKKNSVINTNVETGAGVTVLANDLAN